MAIYDYSQYPSNEEIADYLSNKDFLNKYGLTIGEINPSDFTSSFDFKTGETGELKSNKTYFMNGKPVTRELLMDISKQHRNDIHNSELALLRSILLSKDKLASLEGYLLAGKNLMKIGATGAASIFGGPYIGKGLELAGKAIMPSTYFSGLTGLLGDAAVYSYFFTDAAKKAANSFNDPNANTWDKVANATMAGITALPFIEPTIKAGELLVKGVLNAGKWLGENIGLLDNGIRFGDFLISGPLKGVLYSGVPMPSVSRISQNTTSLEDALRSLPRELYNRIGIRGYGTNNPVLVDTRDGRTIYFRNGRLEYEGGESLLGNTSRLNSALLAAAGDIQNSASSGFNNATLRQAASSWRQNPELLRAAMGEDEITLPGLLISSTSSTAPTQTGRDAVQALMRTYRKNPRYVNTRNGDPITITEGSLNLSKEDLANFTPSEIQQMIQEKTHLLLEDYSIAEDYSIPIEEALKLIDSGLATYDDFIAEGATFNKPFYPSDLDWDRVFDLYIYPHIDPSDGDLINTKLRTLRHGDQVESFLTGIDSYFKKMFNLEKVSQRTSLQKELDTLNKEYQSLSSELERLKWFAENYYKVEDLENKIKRLRVDDNLLHNIARAQRLMFYESRPVPGKVIPTHNYDDSFSTASYPLWVKSIIKGISSGISVPRFTTRQAPYPAELNNINRYGALRPTEELLDILRANQNRLGYARSLEGPLYSGGPNGIRMTINGEELPIKYAPGEEIAQSLNDQIRSMLNKYIKDSKMNLDLMDYFKVESYTSPHGGRTIYRLPGTKSRLLILFNRKSGGKLIKRNKFNNYG